MSKTVKFTVSMPADTFQELESIRSKTGKTRSQFIRDAIRSWNTESQKPPVIEEESAGYGKHLESALIDLKERRRRAIEAAGMFRSGVTDLSSRHDHYLEEAYAETSPVKAKNKDGSRRRP